MRVPVVEFQPFDAGKLVAVGHPVPAPAPPVVSRQGEGGGRPTKGYKTCVVCKRSRKAKEKVDPAKCLTNAAAAVPEPGAFDVKLLKGSADWTAALKGGATAWGPGPGQGTTAWRPGLGRQNPGRNEAVCSAFSGSAGSRVLQSLVGRIQQAGGRTGRAAEGNIAADGK